MPVTEASQVALVLKNPPANAGNIRDAGLIPGLSRSPEGGCGDPLQYSCLENPMARGAWWAMVHRVARVGHDWSNLTLICALYSLKPKMEKVYTVSKNKTRS